MRTTRRSASSWPWHLLLAAASVLVGFAACSGPAQAAASAVVLASGMVAEASSPFTGALSSVPTDGRLRGQDFTAVVSSVSWPQSVTAPSGVAYVAGTGRRLVAFTLSVTQASANAGIGNAPTGVKAELKVGVASRPVSMSAIDQQIAGGTSGSSPTTGTDSFVASVPARGHDVTLSLTEGVFSQSLDLWTLERMPPSPVVLYRDPNASSVAGSAAVPFHLAFTNPADGFSSSDDAEVSSATLSWFSPDGSGSPTDPAQAYLVVGLQSSYPDVPNGQPNWGHFFSGFTPLAGNRLTFTPTGGAAVPGASSTTAFSSASAANDDDGIFDALYRFAVPATTTGGTLSVTPGPAAGTEYTGFTGTGNTVPIDLTAAATDSLSFPAVPSTPRAQKKPPWVGAPLPATGLAADQTPGSASGATNGSSGGGLPIWLVVLVLVVVAAGVIAVQRLRRRSAPTVATTTPVSEAVVSAPIVDTAEPVPSPGEHAPAPRAAPAQPERGAVPGAPRSLVLGPPASTGWRKASDRRFIEELFHYLVFHDTHHRSAEQILIGVRPNSSTDEDLTRKSVHTYLSELRTCIGAEHLPNAAVAGGYLMVGASSDWADFVLLNRQADAIGGEEARALRKEALALVRGQPFEGIAADTYEWVGAEHLVSTMTIAIARCARRLADDLLEIGDTAGAEDAARAGLRGAPDDFDLWRFGALALFARGERSTLRLWMADAAEHLEPDEIARIDDELRRHDDDPSTDAA